VRLLNTTRWHGGTGSPRLLSDSQVQVVLAASVTVAATFATYCADRAGDERQAQARDMQRRGAGVVEVVRQVYSNEAPRAFLHAWACGGERSRDALPSNGTARLRLALEADIAAMTARTWAAGATDGADDVVSCAASGRYDPIARLSELSATEISNHDVPSGDRGAEWARMAAMSSCVPVVAALTLLLVRRLRRRRKATEIQRVTGGDARVALIEQPWEAEGTTGERTARTIAWALLTILPVPAVVFALAAGQARADADAQASEIYASIGGSGQIDSLRVSAGQLAAMRSSLGDARQFVALDTDYQELAAEETVVGKSETLRGNELGLLAQRLTRPPMPSDTLPNHLTTALTSTPETWERDLATQIENVDHATELGKRRRLIDIAMLIAALTSTVLAVGSQDGPRRTRRHLRLPAGMLALALLLAAGSLVGL
jgi:hypothetical protein